MEDDIEEEKFWQCVRQHFRPLDARDDLALAPYDHRTYREDPSFFVPPLGMRMCIPLASVVGLPVSVRTLLAGVVNANEVDSLPSKLTRSASAELRHHSAAGRIVPSALEHYQIREQMGLGTSRTDGKLAGVPLVTAFTQQAVCRAPVRRVGASVHQQPRHVAPGPGRQHVPG